MSYIQHMVRWLLPALLLVGLFGAYQSVTAAAVCYCDVFCSQADYDRANVSGRYGYSAQSRNDCSRSAFTRLRFPETQLEKIRAFCPNVPPRNEPTLGIFGGETTRQYELRITNLLRNCSGGALDFKTNIREGDQYFKTKATMGATVSFYVDASLIPKEITDDRIVSLSCTDCNTFTEEHGFTTAITKTSDTQWRLTASWDTKKSIEVYKQTFVPGTYSFTIAARTSRGLSKEQSVTVTIAAAAAELGPEETRSVTESTAVRRKAQPTFSPRLRNKIYGLNQLSKSIRTPGDLIGKVIGGVLGVVGTVALGMFIYGGLMWMTARGNADKTKQATKTILWGALGVIVILASFGLGEFILRAFLPS